MSHLIHYYCLMFVVSSKPSLAFWPFFIFVLIKLNPRLDFGEKFLVGQIYIGLNQPNMWIL